MAFVSTGTKEMRFITSPKSVYYNTTNNARALYTKHIHEICVKNHQRRFAY